MNGAVSIAVRRLAYVIACAFPVNVRPLRCRPGPPRGRTPTIFRLRLARRYGRTGSRRLPIFPELAPSPSLVRESSRRRSQRRPRRSRSRWSGDVIAVL
jgi:hypothetical protein